VRCTGSWPPRASAVTGASPIGCWPWAAPSSWNTSPTVPGNGPMANRSSSARLGCLSNGCLVWLEVLARRSCRSMPGERGYPKRATVAGSRRKPARSVGIPVPVGLARSAISSRPGWHASWIQTPPCSAWVRRTRPGRGGSPPCKRRMSGPSTTNPRGAGVCLPPLVGPLGLARVRVGRLQKGRLVGPESADAVALVVRAAQRERWSRSEPPGFSQESGSESVSDQAEARPDDIGRPVGTHLP
jgi:hypothetical protein